VSRPILGEKHDVGEIKLARKEAHGKKTCMQEEKIM